MTTAPVAIALGSNLGNSLEILEAALVSLDDWPGIRVTARSQWYITAPIGPPQPDYLNGCALLETTCAPAELMQVLLQIEAQFGRERRERWGARTLDLDLLLFNHVILETPELTIPHPRMNDRAFVLVPLAEIAADWIEPQTGKTIAQLAQMLDSDGVRPLQLNLHPNLQR
jgi:2-amino-4-hydroxy-6-hydroxymethyldihydropteridine diphosphokinase